MTRRSFRPHLNQIRCWVRQGRTDTWIAQQLEVTVQQIQAFKREQELEADGEPTATAAEEVDLRAEDDEAIAAELEAEAAPRAEEEAARRRGGRPRGRGGGGRAPRRKPLRERPRRRGAQAAARPAPAAAPQPLGPHTQAHRGPPLEGTFDHGEEGYGLWLDPAVEDDPVYAEHWAGHRPVEVTIEEDQIVIRRAGGDESGDDG